MLAANRIRRTSLDQIRILTTDRGDMRSAIRIAPIAFVLLVAILSPWITPYNPLRVVGQPSEAPGTAHWLGTDPTGFDVFSQLVAGTRTDVIMAFMMVVVASTIGVSFGLIIGLHESDPRMRGFLCRSIARFFDFIQALPSIVVCLAAISFYGAKPLTLIVSVGIVLCPIQMRLVRTEVLRIRSEAYLDAARIAGLSELQLTVKHVLPNSIWPALENSTVLFGIGIIIMSALGFLGIGLPPPTPEWGAMISHGAADVSVGRWWSAGFPTLALIFTVSSLVMASTVLFPKRRGS